MQAASEKPLLSLFTAGGPRFLRPSSPPGEAKMSVTSDEVNFLVYRYLQESGKGRARAWPRGSHRPRLGDPGFRRDLECSRAQGRLWDRPVPGWHEGLRSFFPRLFCSDEITLDLRLERPGWMWPLPGGALAPAIVRAVRGCCVRSSPLD